jgi:hypothetical protein
MSADDHVEPRGQRRQQRRDVRLRPTGLGERDEDQEARPALTLLAAG